jgi:PE family
MSFVTTQPQMLTAAASDLQAIDSALSACNAAAAGPMTGVVPVAADEVSALTAEQFAAHARIYQAVSAQAVAVLDMFVAAWPPVPIRMRPPRPRTRLRRAKPSAAMDLADGGHSEACSQETGSVAAPGAGPVGHRPARAPGVRRAREPCATDEGPHLTSRCPTIHRDERGIALVNASLREIGNGDTVSFMLSFKPPSGNYTNLYEKVRAYTRILSNPVQPASHRGDPCLRLLLVRRLLSLTRSCARSSWGSRSLTPLSTRRRQRSSALR